MSPADPGDDTSIFDVLGDIAQTHSRAPDPVPAGTGDLEWADDDSD